MGNLITVPEIESISSIPITTACCAGGLLQDPRKAMYNMKIHLFIIQI